MVAAEVAGKKVALLFIDLDRFKEINDTRGHDAGDALLKEVASRIRKHLPLSATAARIGGRAEQIIRRPRYYLPCVRKCHCGFDIGHPGQPLRA
jgi:diguanylate cyclase (GGDEF)-like protein